MPQFELAFSTAWFVGILLFFLSAGLAYFYYRRTLPPLPRGRRAVLALLRGIALFFSALLLIEPLVSLVHTKSIPPAVAVLVDNTQSMTLEDKDVRRADLLNAELASVEDLSLPSGGAMHYYLFGSSLDSARDRLPDSLSLDGEATNLSGALRELAGEKEERNLRAVLLLTDGASNAGENPLYAALDLGVPVLAVGIGDSSHPRDIGITRVTANEIVYEGTGTPVDATIRSSGFPGKSATVFLEREGRVVDQQQVQLQEGVRDYRVRLNYTAEGE